MATSEADRGLTVWGSALARPGQSAIEYDSAPERVARTWRGVAAVGF